jgi:hypothetical protein
MANIRTSFLIWSPPSYVRNMYPFGTYGNTSFVVFPYFSCVEMTTDHPSTGSPSSLGQYDGLCCMPRGGDCCSGYRPILENGKLRSEESRRISVNDVSC